jgi:putative transposase
MILSLYSRGMTTADIAAHLREVYGVDASKELISNVTDVVVDEIKAWQSRPLDEARAAGSATGGHALQHPNR